MSIADSPTATLPAPHAEGGILTVQVLRSSADAQVAADDRVAVEAPLEFQLHHPALGPEPVSFGTTMRTPGDDEWLAAGLLYGEGIVNRAADIDAIETSTRRPNVVNVRLHPSVEIVGQAPARRFSAGSSCGVCGTHRSRRCNRPRRRDPHPQHRPVPLRVLFQLPERMRASQSRFADTGGIHAAAVFDFSGTLHNLAEDVGRHNAFDKLVGMSLMSGKLPLNRSIVLLSGRASFELVQKALRAGVSVLAAIGAPSSLAVNLSEAAGLTLAGFLRQTHCNVYTHPERLTLA